MLSPPNNRLAPVRSGGGSTQPASSSFEGECNEASIPLALDAQNNVLASIFTGCSDLLLQLLQRADRIVTYRHDDIARAQPLRSSRAILRDFGDDGTFCRIGQRELLAQLSGRLGELEAERIDARRRLRLLRLGRG